MEQIEYLRNKMMAALKIPKAFLGYEEGVGSKATLAAEDVRFSRTIERLQRIVVSELEKIAIVHLYTQGFDDEDLIDFNLELTNPSMIHEQEKMELLTQKVDIANNLMEYKIMSREWIYDNIFDMTQHEKEKVFDEIIEDKKQAFRFEQIESEGNDPAESGEKAGDDDDGGFSIARKGTWGGSKKDPHKPESRSGREFKGGSPVATSKGSTLVAREGILDQLKKKYNRIEKSGLLNEESLIEDE